MPTTRTTVTIDPDVQALLRRVMKKTGEPFKQVLNNALRDALGRAVREAPAGDAPYRQPTFNMGKPLVDLTKANQLAGELEDEELIAKMRQGR